MYKFIICAENASGNKKELAAEAELTSLYCITIIGLNSSDVGMVISYFSEFFKCILKINRIFIVTRCRILQRPLSFLFPVSFL